MGNTLDVVVGGQFGSEAKGRVTLERIRHRMQTANWVGSMRVGGPNAGHVVLDQQGRRWAMRALPVGFVEPGVNLFVAAGSEVDLAVLREEIEAVEAAGHRVRHRLFVHPEATVIESHHVHQEQHAGLAGKLGSTAKGIGAARADRLWRVARRVGDLVDAGELDPEDIGGVVNFDSWLTMWLRDNDMRVSVVIEGTQGYGLGLHAGHYPYTTSGNCRAVDFMAQAGVGPWHLDPVGSEFRVHVVIRPFPIRVAGNSGELAGETDWSTLGLPPEHTTVTQKERRVGTFDPVLVTRAVLANGPAFTQLHLSMADQVAPELSGHTAETWGARALPPALLKWIEQVPYSDQITTLGTGPDSYIDLDRIPGGGTWGYRPAHRFATADDATELEG